MSRSKWKGPFLNTKTLQDLKNKSKKINIATRNSNIVPTFVGLNFNIHNGKTFTKLTVTNEMIGHKFGEFSPTRKRFIFKKNKKK
jgi:small subunit ribosomal protein S19